MYTLNEARSMLPQIREITENSHAEVEHLKEELEKVEDAPERRQLEVQINTTVRQWAQQVMRLGVEVKGLWIADWDSGDGYYWCWQLGEDDIEFFHRYDDGFAGRRSVENLLS
jgi:hypothetical protein